MPTGIPHSAAHVFGGARVRVGTRRSGRRNAKLGWTSSTPPPGAVARARCRVRVGPQPYVYRFDSLRPAGALARRSPTGVVLSSTVAPSWTSMAACEGGPLPRLAFIAEAPPAYERQPRLLDRVRAAIRARHYSRRTENAYVAWVPRYVLFHGRRHPREMGAPEVSRFLSSLAVDAGVSASTQNQALGALLFIYKEVLGQDLPWLDDVVRAKAAAPPPGRPHARRGRGRHAASPR